MDKFDKKDKKDQEMMHKEIDERDKAHVSQPEHELSIEEQRELDIERSKELSRLEKEDVVISPARVIWNNFKSRKITLIGVGLFIFVFLFSVILPLFLPETGLDSSQIFQPPSWDHPFGTDYTGRDLFIRVSKGGSISLYVGVVATSIATIIGTIIGSISGYYHGLVDNILQRFTEIVRSFPFLPLIITLSAALGSRSTEEQRIFLVMMILGFISWTGLARLLRGQILSIREQEYILAAKAVGVKNMGIITKHVLPNVVSIIIVFATLNFASNILVESGLSFLGFGVQEPGASWGLILQKGTEDSLIIQDYPWAWFFPGIFILITVLSVNFIGDGLRDAVDPKNNAR